MSFDLVPSFRSQPHRLFRWMALAAVVGGCQLDLESDLDKLARIEVCDGMTLEELINATTVSDDCKALLQIHLPQPETNFSSTLIVLGAEDEADGSTTVYLHGVDANGTALGQADWSSMQVSVQVDGSWQVLADGQFTFSLVGEAPKDLLSIGVVNDYSGSMSSSDLQTVANIETDLFTYVPPVYEAEVTQFSSEVVVKQSFTSEQSVLLDAVSYDAEFDRQLTALYDGMGAGLDSLLTRTRPLRLLIVSTDGQENDSKQYEKAEIIDKVTREKVPVLMLGALFAQPSELRELAGPRGVYFYTPYYADARAQVEQYLESLSNLVAVNIPEEHRGDGPVMVQAGDAEGQHQP